MRRCWRNNYDQICVIFKPKFLFEIDPFLSFLSFFLSYIFFIFFFPLFKYLRIESNNLFNCLIWMSESKNFNLNSINSNESINLKVQIEYFQLDQFDQFNQFELEYNLNSINSNSINLNLINSNFFNSEKYMDKF